MKTIFYILPLLLLPILVHAQVTPSAPLSVQKGRLIEVMLDQNAPVSFTVQDGSYGPFLEVSAAVNITECTGMFNNVSDVMSSGSMDMSTHVLTMQLFFYDPSEAGFCLGYAARPITFRVSAFNPTLLKQLNGKSTSITPHAEVQSGKWVVTSVDIRKDQ